MKILFSLFFMMGAYLTAQVVSVYPKQFSNTAYVGSDNLISVMVENSDCGIIKVLTDNGDLFKLNGCDYRYHPVKSGLSIFVIIKNDTIIDSVECKIARLPDPVVALVSDNNCYSNYKSYGLLDSVDSLTLIFDTMFFNASYKIVSYEVITYENDELLQIYNEGAIFNQQVKVLIAKSNENQLIFFDNIKVKNSLGQIRTIRGCVHQNKKW